MSKTSTETRHALSGATMGTRWSVVFFAPGALPPDGLEAALAAAVERVDRQMSNWKPESDLNRLNAAPVGNWVAVPRGLMTVLAEALRIGRATQGAFEIGVGPLVSAWGFGPGPRQPDRAAIAAAEAAPRVSAMEALELDVAGGRARKRAPLGLDLCGIAKGFGVDELGRVLDGFGIGAWLAGIDGEMRARGLKPGGEPWAVAHERPDRHRREPMGVIELTDMAVATSGNYRHWAEVAGGIVSHTMDPERQVPLANGVASVSVLAPTCMAADAWATALLVLGAEAGLRKAREAGLDAIFVLEDGSVQGTL